MSLHLSKTFHLQHILQGTTIKNHYNLPTSPISIQMKLTSLMSITAKADKPVPQSGLKLKKKSCVVRKDYA